MENTISDGKTMNRRALSEYESKKLLSTYGIPVTREKMAVSRDEAAALANDTGYPVVVKGCGSAMTHKTEHGMVRLNLESGDAVAEAFDEIMAAGMELEGVLIQEMVSGKREFVIGLNRDPQFGPCVMFGVGGIFTEVFKDVTFRIAPLTREDAEEMLEEINARDLLDEFRGEPPVDRETLINALVGAGRIGVERDDVSEIDINPLIASDHRIVAVDALVIVED